MRVLKQFCPGLKRQKDKKKAGFTPTFKFVLLREGRICFRKIHPTQPLDTKVVLMAVTTITGKDFYHFLI
jgi:hypothetical protein